MKIYGKNPVLERLKADPRSIRRIFVVAGNPEHGYIVTKAKKYGLPISVVTQQKMAKLGRSHNAQGLMIVVDDFEYKEYTDLLEEAAVGKLTLVFLDSLNDPQNLGAILRTCGCLGGFAIVLPTHDSVEVTEAALRVACGGENYVKVTKVKNLNNAIREAKEKGVWVVGSVVNTGEDIRTVTFPSPLGIVVGSEDKGIRPAVQERLDVRITIPMIQSRMSLNAAHAASILCYESFKQRPESKKGKSKVPSA